MPHDTYCITRCGRSREANEDRHLIKPIGSDMLLLAVADGMGGHALGSEAAQLSIDALSQLQIDRKDPSESLRCAVQKADANIRSIVSRAAELEGMGSTLTAVLVDGGKAHWVHVGDTRLYRLKQGEVSQVTVDQNMAQFLVEEGELTVEQARRHPSQNQLDQSIGCGDCEPVMGQFDVHSGDLLALTTDGLHGEIPAKTFSDLIGQNGDLPTKGEVLLQTALQSGGRDDITLVLAEVKLAS